MDNIIMNQLELYSQRAKVAQDNGDEDLKQFFIQQGYDLIQAYGDSIMTVTDQTT